MKTSVKKLPSTVSLLLLAVLACVASLTLRRDAGVWLTVPFYPLCVAAACFLPLKLWQKGTFFLVITAALNLIESSTLSESVPMIIAAAVCFVLTTVAVGLFRKKKPVTVLFGVLAIAVYIGCSMFFFGNPVSAFGAQAKLNDYISAHYTTDGGNHFGSVQYDFSSGLYTIEAYSEQYPAETALIFCSGDYIVDHYKVLTEDQELRTHAQTLTSILRKSFPDDSFTVIRAGIDGFPGEGVYDSYTSEYAPEKMSFCVQISGKPTFEKFYTAANDYARTLALYGFVYDEITYLGGSGLHYRIAIKPATVKDIYPTKERISVYVLRHPEQYFHLEQNGLADLWDGLAVGTFADSIS